LVEDDADAILVEELLREADEHFDLLRARSIADAIRRLTEGAVQCIYLDLDLPDANGLEAVQAIMEHDPGVLEVDESYRRHL